MKVGPDAVIESMQIIMRQDQRDLDQAHAENLALRALLAEHGISAPAPAHVMSLERLRRLEDVLDLARAATRRPTAAALRALRQAADVAGRQP